MRMSRVLAAAVAITIIFGGGGSAFAAIVNPGETVPTTVDDLINPTGDLVDQDARTVTFQYVPPDGFAFPDVQQSEFDLTLRSEVYRDPATQRLSFVYRWEDVPSFFGREGATLNVTSFAGFSTDATSELGGLEGTITRSADGGNIQANTSGAGLGTIPSLLVVTDATEYDQNGTLSGSVGDVMLVYSLNDPEQVQEVRLGIANVELTGTFQPITDTGNPVIPLPAGVWGGLVMLGGAAGVARRLRRR